MPLKPIPVKNPTIIHLHKPPLGYIIEAVAFIVVILFLILALVHVEVAKAKLIQEYKTKMLAYFGTQGVSLYTKYKTEENREIFNEIHTRPAPIGCLIGIRREENGIVLTYGVTGIRNGLIPGENEQLASACIIIEEEMTNYVSQPEHIDSFMHMLAERWSPAGGAPAIALWEKNVKYVWKDYERTTTTSAKATTSTSIPAEQKKKLKGTKGLKV
jgi:hypothetical protein